MTEHDTYPIEKFTLKYGDTLTVKRSSGLNTDTLFTLRDNDTDSSVISYVNDGVAHALADWIIANVPKPEPTPLPTKRAAVVKSGVAVFTLGDSEEPKWLELDSNGDLWLPSDTLAERGFEVIFEGVDD